jgi:hypothetical protein
MRIFKNRWFERFAQKQKISDEELQASVQELENGICDADLGGNVYKQRIARSGKGKSGGYRVIVLFRSSERSFFVYGFPKSNRGNIDQKETQDFKELAKDYLGLSDRTLGAAVKNGKFVEVLGVGHEKEILQ